MECRSGLADGQEFGLKDLVKILEDSGWSVFINKGKGDSVELKDNINLLIKYQDCNTKNSSISVKRYSLTADIFPSLSIFPFHPSNSKEDYAAYERLLKEEKKVDAECKLRIADQEYGYADGIRQANEAFMKIIY